MRKVPWKPKAFYIKLAKEINNILSNTTEPLTAKELAQKTGEHHTDVNRCLYFFMNNVNKNISHEWLNS